MECFHRLLTVSFCPMDLAYKKDISKNQIKKLVESDEATSNTTNLFDVESVYSEFEIQIPQIHEALNNNDLTHASNALLSVSKLAQLASFGSAQYLLVSNIFTQILGFIETPIIQMVVPILSDLSKSPENLLITMLQLGFLDHINYLSQIEDRFFIRHIVIICENLIKRSPFFISLVYSTGLVHKVVDTLMSRNGSDCFEMLGTHLLKLFCQYGAFSSPETVSLYHEFIDGCLNKSTFNLELFQDFCSNGISLESRQPFTNLFNLCISTQNPDYLYLIIYSCCCLLVHNCDLSKYFFGTIPIGNNIYEYVKMFPFNQENINLLYQISIFITDIFIAEVDLPYQVVSDFFAAAAILFQCNNSEIVAQSTNALINIVITQPMFAKDMLEEKYVKLMNLYITKANFKIQTKVIWLLMIIACHCPKEASEFITEGEMEQILVVLQSEQKKIAMKVLNTFKTLFKIDEKNRLKGMFDDLGGDDVLYQLMDGEDEDLQKLSIDLYDSIHGNADEIY